jgi:hypothetical protein
MSNQRHLLPAADRQLLDRLVQEAQDPAERGRRQRLFGGNLVDFADSCERADEVMSALLTPAVGGDLDRRDRIVLLIVWNVIRDQDAAYFAPLEVRAPAPTCLTSLPTAVQPAAAQAPATPSAQATRTGNAVPAAQAERPAPIPPAPCTASAGRFLRAALAAGERPSREVQAEGQRLGLTPAMLRAARQRLGIVTEKRGYGQRCRSYWSLPVSTDAHTGLDRVADVRADRNRSANGAGAIEARSVHGTENIVQTRQGMEHEG